MKKSAIRWSIGFIFVIAYLILVQIFDFSYSYVTGFVIATIGYIIGSWVYYIFFGSNADNITHSRYVAADPHYHFFSFQCNPYSMMKTAIMYGMYKSDVILDERILQTLLYGQLTKKDLKNSIEEQKTISVNLKRANSKIQILIDYDLDRLESHTP